MNNSNDEAYQVFQVLENFSENSSNMLNPLMIVVICQPEKVECMK